MQEIRRLREEKGWGQKELAFHAHLSQSVISEIETGKRSPSARTLQKLAGALGVEVRDLFPLGQVPLFREPPEEGRRSSKTVTGGAHLSGTGTLTAAGEVVARIMQIMDKRREEKISDEEVVEQIRELVVT